jgi:hypothetical protein
VKTVLALIAGFFLSVLAQLGAPVPPAPMPVIRCIVHPWTKRARASVLGIGATLRGMFAILYDLPNVFLRRFMPTAYLRAGVLNLFLDPLPVFPYQLAPIKENMPRGTYIRDLLIRISGNVDVSGGTTDGALNTEPIARLIRRFTVRWDNFDFVQPMEIRDLAALSRRLVGQPLSGTPLTIPGIQNTDFELSFFVPFARSYNADPFDTVLPPLRVRKEFVVEAQFERGLTNATSSPGSAALITGGDRDVILSDVQMEILPREAKQAARPWYLPVITAYETEQYASANPRLVLDIEGQEPFDGVLFRELQDALRDPITNILDLTFESKNTKIFEQVTREQLRAIEEDMFDGVIDADEAGNLFIQFSDGGKLGNVVNPAEMTLPKFEVNVDTPANPPAVLRALFMELLSVPDVTRR